MACPSPMRPVGSSFASSPSSHAAKRPGLAPGLKESGHNSVRKVQVSHINFYHDGRANTSFSDELYMTPSGCQLLSNHCQRGLGRLR